MSRSIRILILALLGACASTVLASAQAVSSPTDVGKQSSTTAAYVYVITNPTSSSSQLDGYSAASDGSLTLLPDSPFWKSNNPYVTGLANTAHWLFVGDGT